MKIIDMHCDTMLESYRKKKNLYDLEGHINIEKLKQGGSFAQCFALFIPQQKEAEECNIDLAPYPLYHELVKTFKQNMAECSADIKQVFCKQDILVNDKLSALLTVEDGTFVEGKYERIDEMHSDGVRMLALTWNYENCFGYANNIDPKLHARGLKEFGKDAIRYMNEKGIIVDVSHLSEGGFWDVVENSKTNHIPFVASHSCCREICSHQRNLNDRQLKALADCGSIAGVNFYSAFLENDGKVSRVSDIIKHLEHMKNVCGVDAMAFGSDFDGIDCEVEYKDFTGFNLIEEAMTKVFTDDEIDKISHKNFLRIFK